jgi:hypothetical protein
MSKKMFPKNVESFEKIVCWGGIYLKPTECDLDFSRETSKNNEKCE